MEETRPFPQIEQQENKVALACYVFSWAVEAFSGRNIESELYKERRIVSGLIILNRMVLEFLSSPSSYNLVVADIGLCFHRTKISDSYPSDIETHTESRFAVREKGENLSGKLSNQLMVEAFEHNREIAPTYGEVLLARIIEFKTAYEKAMVGTDKADELKAALGIIYNWASRIRIDSILIANTPVQNVKGLGIVHRKELGLGIRVSLYWNRLQLALVVFEDDGFGGFNESMVDVLSYGPVSEEDDILTDGRLEVPGILENNRILKVYEGFEAIVDLMEELGEGESLRRVKRV